MERARVKKARREALKRRKRSTRHAQSAFAFADQIKDLAQGAVEKVEELVKVTATKIKDVVA
jgi:hypothetical protein